jgi:NAD(P)-dependent dehydrogenase (short-subunit alcohol dehydrogenase family)
MKAAFEQLEQRFGRLDIVVANAGINGVWAPIDEITPEEWDETIKTNLKGTYLTLHYSVPRLKAAGSGAVVIVSSVNGTRTFSNTGSTAYSCTKAAQVTMAKMIALELARQKIRVNVVCPGRIETEIQDNTFPRNIEKVKEPVEFPRGHIPLTDNKAGSADEVAELILFLVSDRSRHITGTPVWIDGAESLLVA